jgi:ketosteroid isomerase-like protein
MADLDRFVRDFFERLEAGDLDAVAAMMDLDCDFAAPGFSARGPAPALAWMQPFLAAFPGIHHEVFATIEGTDAIAFEMEITGTHTAPLAGPDGELPPTGRAVRFPSSNHWRLRDGQIVSYHAYFDLAGFMAQLGMEPSAAAAAS